MKTALVLGASGGIGAALAEQLSRDHAVTRLSRSADGLDVTDAAAMEQALASLGPIDTAFIATGILAPDGAAPEKTLEAIDADSMREVFSVNALGPALALRALAPKLSDTARVGVLTARVGSIGDNGMGGWYSYRAAKAAANQITRTAAIEIGRKRKGAAIVALHPGTVDTPFTANYRATKLSPADAAARLVEVLTSRSPAQNGMFFDYKGDEVPW